MSMTKILCGLAALPLVAGVALAEPAQQSPIDKASAKQPTQLSEQQMDKVTAGADFFEVTISNTAITTVALHERTNTVTAGPVTGGVGLAAGNTITCPTCFLLINNPALSVGSAFRE